MNYSYQTIAHNTITVTDPADTVPAPAPAGRVPRPIANDGGQRRIGSGWGVEPAPLDLGEWQAKREIYHTGKIQQLLMKDGLTVAVSDVTPAYTNALSGQGTFSHRTRRVELFQRVFGYDRSDDVIVVYDRVTSTDADFRKRWLLHTIEQPQITADGFIAHIDPTTKPGHAGGRLEAHVVLPKDPIIQSIGGRGLAYFVDNHNYDEGVAAAIRQRKDTETGAWRIEVSPPVSATDDEFLVVLIPTLNDRIPTQRLRRLIGPKGVGVEVTGPRHVARWWFDTAKDRMTIETEGAEGPRSYELSLARQTPALADETAE